MAFIIKKPCKYGHTPGKYYVSNGKCVECVKEMSKKLYLAKKESAELRWALDQLGV